MVVAVDEITVTLGWPGAGSEEGMDIHTFPCRRDVVFYVFDKSCRFSIFEVVGSLYISTCFHVDVMELYYLHLSFM